MLCKVPAPVSFMAKLPVLALCIANTATGLLMLLMRSQHLFPARRLTIGEGGWNGEHDMLSELVGGAGQVQHVSPPCLECACKLVQLYFRPYPVFGLFRTCR